MKSGLSREDRARRGYSPPNSENFASLLGEEGPNDLVRKFFGLDHVVMKMAVMVMVMVMAVMVVLRHPKRKIWV